MPAEAGQAGLERQDDIRILIVDDEPTLLQIATRIIARLGYVTIEAGSAEEALQVAREERERIALVITDVVMPGMDGIRMAEAMRMELPGTPVLFISGHHMGDLVRLNGMPDDAPFLQKPFTPKALAAAVEAMMSQNGSRGLQAEG